VTIGVISDTHGMLRPEAIAALQGSQLILHAGDVGDPAILEALRAIAPTVAVRGNVDKGEWAAALPLSTVVGVGERRVYMLHDIAALDLDPLSAGIAAVIFGHSHRPSAERRNGVLFFNPGAAGPRRFKLPITVARLRVDGDELTHEIITLDV
jgi:putative phosphoesterase